MRPKSVPVEITACHIQCQQVSHARLRRIFETEGDGVDWTNVQPRIIETVRQLEREK